jgi:hypothetical protein
VSSGYDTIITTRRRFWPTFVPTFSVVSDAATNVFELESLQVAHYYRNGGKFDMHHEGFYHVVTALTYVNGIAGTWFPFA